MKPTRPFAIAAALLLALPLLTLPSAPVYSYSSGAPPMFSGPEQYCNACHGDPVSNPVNSGDGSVTITAPSTFSPGEVIAITVTIVNTAPPPTRQGFELSARDADLTPVGTFNVDGTMVQYAQGNTDYVTHTSSSNTEESWTFEWVAPDADVPPTVTLYAAGNASNNNFVPDEGDKIYSDEHVLALATANEPGAMPLAFRLDAPFPNPVRTTATAQYALDRPAEVEARLLDGRGRVVRELERGRQSAGAHTLHLNTDGLPAGAYFLTLSTPEGTQAQPVSVVR